MLTLDVDQKNQLLIWLEEFLKQPSVANEGAGEPYRKFDERRASAVPAINSILQRYLSGDITIEEFNDKNEKICREHPYWGFKGFSGQMQLNHRENIDWGGKPKAAPRVAQTHFHDLCDRRQI